MDYETVHETIIEIVGKGEFKDGAEEILEMELSDKDIFSQNEQEEIIQLVTKLNVDINQSAVAKQLTEILLNSPDDAKIFIKEKILESLLLL